MDQTLKSTSFYSQRQQNRFLVHRYGGFYFHPNTWHARNTGGEKCTQPLEPRSTSLPGLPNSPINRLSSELPINPVTCEFHSHPPILVVVNGGVWPLFPKRFSRRFKIRTEYRFNCTHRVLDTRDNFVTGAAG